MIPVVVSQRVDSIRARSETRDALDQRLSELLSSVGIMSFPVPNILLENNLLTWLEHLNPRGVLLSGGNDLGTVENRDNAERTLMRFAFEKKIPLLGICRGMQFIAIEAGAVLSRIEGHISSRHAIRATISGLPKSVNSFHQFGLLECPPGYHVLAYSDEEWDANSIEAIRHHSLPWEGWMWHPEREKSFAEEDLMRLSELYRG